MDRDDHISTTGSSLLAPVPLPVPVADLPAFYRLCTKNQERIRLLAQAFAFLSQCPTLSDGYKLVSQQLRGQRGTSPASLRRLYAEWRKSTDWRCLIDYALEFKPSAAMPEAFIAHLNEIADSSPRSIDGALKTLRANWTNGLSIPGYGTWREWWMRTHPGRPLPRCAPPHPQGWTPRNLRRKLDTSKFRRIAQTRGLTAAKAHRPGLRQSRIGCPVGHIIQFDDMEHDFFVNDFGHKQAVRPLELFAHDYAAAYKTFWGAKPKWIDDTGVTKKLTGDMMRLIVAGHFWSHGYHPEAGTVCVAEHGTACFTDDMARALFDATGGRITISESGFDGRAPHAGLYHGRARGQPGHKASLESHNNLTHNRTQHIPGQTGRNVDTRPENLHGLLKNNQTLIDASEWLPAEFREQLEYPLLEYSQGISFLHQVYHQIATERDHNLEGWQQCGHIIQAIEFAGVVKLLDEIPESDRPMMLALMEAKQLTTRPVLKSRWEVWNAGRAQLRAVSGGTVCQLLGENFSKEKKVLSHAFALESDWLPPGDHRFWGHVITPEGNREELKDGETYQVFVNPFSPNELFVRGRGGRYLGIAPAQPLGYRHRPDTVSAAATEFAKEEGRLLSKLIGRQVGSIVAKRNRHQNNSTVIKSALNAATSRVQAATDALDASLNHSNQHNLNTTSNEDTDPTALW